MYKEQEFRVFLECAPDPVAIINTQGEIILVNAQTEKLFQYQRKELLGKKIEVLIPAHFVSDHISFLNEFLQNPVPRTMGHRGLPLLGRRKDGEEFQLELSLSPIPNDGKELRIFASMRDLTERKQIEEKLKESQDLFRNIFESSLTGILLMKNVRDEQGNVIDFRYELINKRGEELLGRRKADLIGQTILSVFPDFREKGLLSTFLDVIVTGTPAKREITYNFSKPNQWIKSSIVKFEDGLIVSFDDITERRENQKKLEELNVHLEKRVRERTRDLTAANDKLKSINEKLDKYAYMISHDLKAPLANIEGIATFIEDDYQDRPIDKEGQEMLQMMKAKVQDMRDIIENVLQSAKDELISKDRVSLLSIVEEVIESLNPPSHFHFLVQPNLPEVKYQRSALMQIIQNLLTNSIKYMDKEQPLITITWKDIEDSYQICVTDNGPGIPKEKQKTIFNFMEIAHDGDYEVESHGIGLSIVKQLVEQNQGKIWVESTLHKETIFHFTIPKK